MVGCFTEAAQEEAKEFMDRGGVQDSAPEPPPAHRPATNPIRIAWERFRDLTYKLESSKAFQNMTVFVILLNTINLGIIW